jgi:cytochrome c oxidase subunit 2
MNPPALVWFPDEASSNAAEVDQLFFALVALSGVLIVVVFGLLLVFCIRYRAGNRGVRHPYKGSSLYFEMTWTFIPFLIFMGLFVWATHLYIRMYTLPAEGISIDIVGKQWMWKIQHEGGQREINQLHVPINRNILINLTSEDVVHSFFIPDFRIKRDAVPGRYTSMWFKATKVGTYHIFCSQYCGLNHDEMTGEVIVESASDYAHWLESGKPEEDLAVSGEELFHHVGCSGCHALQGAIRAPLLNGLYNSPVALSDGTTVIADRQYLRDSILLPNKQITAGYQALMPTYQGQLSEEQVNALVSYLMSLKNQPDQTLNTISR